MEHFQARVLHPKPSLSTTHPIIPLSTQKTIMYTCNNWRGALLPCDHSFLPLAFTPLRCVLQINHIGPACTQNSVQASSRNRNALQRSICLLYCMRTVFLSEIRQFSCALLVHERHERNLVAFVFDMSPGLSIILYSSSCLFVSTADTECKARQQRRGAPLACRPSSPSSGWPTCIREPL